MLSIERQHIYDKQGLCMCHVHSKQEKRLLTGAEVNKVFSLKDFQSNRLVVKFE